MSTFVGYDISQSNGTSDRKWYSRLYEPSVEKMDWQLLGLSFITVFFAEIGDKSQLAAIALSGSSQSPRAVFLGTVVALVLASFLGVLVGAGAAQILPERLLKATAAIGFIFLSLRLIWPESDGNSL